MNRTYRNSLVLLAALAGLFAVAPACRAEIAGDDLAQKAQWSAPKYEKTRRQILAWIDAQQAEDGVKNRAAEQWPATEPQDNLPQLDRLAQTIATVEPAARALVELCSGPRVDPTLPDFALLTREKLSPLVRNNLRLLLGRWLARERLFDEAQQQLADMASTDVVDPASLLFYQSVVHHHLLDKDQAIAAMDQLLSAGQQVPLRYRTVAELMKADIEPLEDESLDHIARRMRDVRRRLDLGRAGKKVLEVEDGVIASLEKLIKKLEEQQQQQQSSGGGGGGSPAKDSAILGGTGPGNVTKKDIGDKTSWGDLPPKKRREAMQQIGKDYPPHLREVIEQYFKRIAADKGDNR